MKTFIQSVALLLVFCVSSTSAEHADHAHDDKRLSHEKQVSVSEGMSCKNRINIQVEGLVCDFCARALEKVFGRHNGVLGIDVDLDNTRVSIAMQPGETIDDATLGRLVKDSGYNVVAIDKGC